MNKVSNQLESKLWHNCELAIFLLKLEVVKRPFYNNNTGTHRGLYSSHGTFVTLVNYKLFLGEWRILINNIWHFNTENKICETVAVTGKELLHLKIFLLLSMFPTEKDWKPNKLG